MDGHGMDIKELPPAKQHHFKPGAACAHAQAAAEEGLPPTQPGSRRPRPGLGSRSSAHGAENHRQQRRRSDGPRSTLGTLSRRGVPLGVKSKLASSGRGHPGPRRQGVTCGRPGKPCEPAEPFACSRGVPVTWCTGRPFPSGTDGHQGHSKRVLGLPAATSQKTAVTLQERLTEQRKRSDCPASCS